MHPNDAETGLPPSQEQVRNALDRILASQQFVRAKRSGALLHYLIQRVLSGDTGNLKEYVVATEVFERDATFDPRVDSLVRVEATRLRSRLKAYYESTGANDPVRIALPVGRYDLLISRASLATPDSLLSKPESGSPRIRTRNWVLVAAALLAALWVSLYFLPLKSSPLATLTALKRVTLENGVFLYPALAPDARWLAYSTDRGSRSRLKLWRHPLDSDRAVQLTFGEHDDINPVISADSQWIAFESKEGQGSVRLMPSGGGASRLVAYFGREPRFSPDSRWLTYWVRSPVTGFGKTYVVPLDRPKEPADLAPEFDDAHAPVWTPDQQHVLFCGTRRAGAGPEEEHNLWVKHVKGGSAINTHGFELLKSRALDSHTRMLSTTAFEFHNQALILTANSRDSTAIWRLPLSQKNWQATGTPELLTSETTAAIHPSVRGRTIVFTSAIHNIDIWSAPMEGGNARVTGNLRRETDTASEDLLPAVSQAGHVLAFLSGPAPVVSLIKKDFPSGKLTNFGQLPGSVNRFKISADGGTGFYRMMEGEGSIKTQAVYSIDLLSAEPRRVCVDCGAPTHVTPDGRLVIYETGSVVARLGALRVSSGEKWDFLNHSHYPVRAGRVSPNARWLAFQLERGRDGIQIYAVPFREGAPVQESEWIQVTDSKHTSQEPSWSHDGRNLYYLSDRDGHRCVWAVPFDPDSGRAGAQFEVLPLHEPRLSPLSHVRRDPLYVGLSIAKDKIVLSLAEMSSSIWTGQLGP